MINEQLHRSISHISASVIVSAAALGMVHSLEPDKLAAVAFESNPEQATRVRENEVGHATVNLGKIMLSASVAGKP